MNPLEKHPTTSWLLAIGIAVIALAAYWPQLDYRFVYDDESLIPNSEVICGGPWFDCLTEPWWPPSQSMASLYRPVTTLTLRVNYAIAGLDPFGYRLTNAVLHAMCSAFVAVLALRLWKRTLPGWAAGLIFAVHPIHAEAVSMVVGRAELLAALFSILLLYNHLGFLEGDRRPRLGHHLTCALLLALAAGSKEHGLLAGVAILLMDIWGRQSRSDFETSAESLPRSMINRLAASHYLGLVLVAGVFLLARWMLFGARTTLPADFIDPFANPLLHQPWLVRAATPAALLTLALRLFICPIGLSPIWSLGGINLPDSLARWDVVVGGMAAIAMILWALLGLWRRQRAGLMLAMAGLFLILPCHFVPAANWLFAERWLYLPSAFLAVVLGGAIRNRWVVSILAIAAGGLALANWNYQTCWRDSDTLMCETVDRQPYNYHGLLGHVAGLNQESRLADGQAEVGRLIERFPDAPRAWYYQALLMDALNRPVDVLEAADRYMELAKPTPMTPQLRQAVEKAKDHIR